MESVREGISVAIRVRPLNSREISSGHSASFQCLPDYNAITQQTRDGVPIEGQYYQYDKVFNEVASTEQVYSYIARDIVNGVSQGINGTIFAYGQTSSGKTFTMLGDEKSPGILELAAEDIFRHIADCENRDFLLRVSFVEIYNEVIRDLLSDAIDSNVAIREDPRKGVYCEASELIITDFESITRALKKGISKRTVEATGMNENSSRSHTIFKLVVESKEQAQPGVDSDGAVLVASLNLVDLAGSESVRHTGNTGQRAKEGGKINQSLLSLSRVIHALSQPGTHVSFRDSKLTRLLQPSLSGNANMSVVCCITPSERYLEETRSTLQFASRAKLVTTNAKVNEVLDEAAKIRRLTKELNMLKDQQKAGILSDTEYLRIESEKAELLKRMKSLQEEKDRQRIQLERLRELVISGGLSKTDKKKKRRHRETWCPGMTDGQVPSSYLQTISESVDGDANVNKASASLIKLSASASPPLKRRNGISLPGEIGADVEDDGEESDVSDDEGDEGEKRVGVSEGKAGGSDANAEVVEERTAVLELELRVRQAEISLLIEEKQELQSKLEEQIRAAAERDVIAQSKILALETELDEYQSKTSGLLSPSPPSQAEKSPAKQQDNNTEIIKCLQNKVIALELQLANSKDMSHALQKELLDADRTIVNLPDEKAEVEPEATRKVSVEDIEDSELMKTLRLELQSANDLIFSLESQLNNSEENVAKIQKEVIMANMTLEQLREDKKGLMSELESSNMAIAKLHMDNEHSVETISTLENNVKLLQSNFNSLAEKLLQKEEEKQAVCEQMAAVETQALDRFEKLDKIRELFETEVSDLSQKLREKETEAAGLGGRLREVEAELKSQIELNDAVTRELETAVECSVSASEEEIRIHTAKLEEAAKENIRLSEELTALQDSKQLLHLEMEELKVRLAALETGNEAKEMANIALALRLDELTKELVDAEVIISQIKEESVSIQSHKQQLELARKSRESLEGRLQSIESSQSYFLEDVERKCVQLGDLVNELEADRSSLQKKLQECFESLALKDDKVQLLTDEIQTLGSQHVQERKALEDLVRSTEEMTGQRIVLLTEQNRELTENNLALEKRVLEILSAFQERIKTLESEHETMEAEKAAVEGQLKDSMALIDELTRRFQERENVISNLESSKEKEEQFLKEINNYESAISKLHVDFDVVKLRNSGLENEIIDLQRVINKLSGEVCEKEEAVARSMDEMNGIKQENDCFKATIKELSGHLVQAGLDVTQSLQSCRNKDEELAVLREKLQQTEETLAQIDSTSHTDEEIEILTGKLTSCEAELVAACKGMDELLEAVEEKEKEIKSLKDSVTTLQQTNSTKENQLLDIINDLETQNASLEESCKDHVEAIESLKDRILALESEIVKDNDMITESISSVSQLTLENQSLRHELSTVSSYKHNGVDLEELIPSLEAKLVTCETEKTELAEKLTTLMAENDRSASHVKELQSELAKQAEEEFQSTGTLRDALEDTVMQLKSRDMTISELQGQILVLEEENRGLSGRILEQESSYQSQNEEISKMNDTISKLEVDHREAMMKLSESECAVENLALQLNDKSQELEAWMAKDVLAAGEKETLLSRIEELQNERLSFLTRIEALQSDVENNSGVSSLLGAIQKEKDVLQERVNELVMDVEANAKASHRNSFLEKQLSEIQIRMDRLQLENEELRSNATEIEERSKQSLEHATESFRHQEEELLQSLEQKNTEYNELSLRLKKTKDLCIEIEKEFSLATERSKVLELDIRRLTEALSSSQVNFDEVIREKENQISAALTRATKAEARAVELDSVLIDIKKERSLLEERVIELHDIIHQQDVKLTTSSPPKNVVPYEEKEQLLQELNRLMEQVVEAEARADSAFMEAKRLREQLMEYDRSSAQEQESIIQAAQSEMDAMRAQFKAMQGKSEEMLQNAILEGRSAKAEERNTRLRLEEISMKLQRTENAYNELEEEMGELRKRLAERESGIGATTRAAQNAVESAMEESERMKRERDETLARMHLLQADVILSNERLAAIEKESLLYREEMKELLEAKDRRIKHLDNSKLTQEQMEKIKKVKEERDKYQMECKSLKKQLQQLMKVHEKVSSESTSSVSSSADVVKEMQIELSDTKMKLSEASHALDTSQTIIGSLKGKLVECSKQLQTYENERDGVLRVLEQFGIDIRAFLMADNGEISEDSSLSAEPDLSEAVSKLGQKFTTLQNVVQSHNGVVAGHLAKIRELEENGIKLATELEEMKSQRNYLEKRYESFKSSSHGTEEQLVKLRSDLESLKLKLKIAEEERDKALIQVSGASDHISLEIQALEEENIELLKENKELRKEAASYRALSEHYKTGGADASSNVGGDRSDSKRLNEVSESSSKQLEAPRAALREILAPKTASEDSRGTVHTFDIENSRPRHLNVMENKSQEEVKKMNSSTSFSKENNNQTTGAAAALSTSDMDSSRGRRNRVKAKALVSDLNANETGGECNQS